MSETTDLVQRRPDSPPEGGPLPVEVGDVLSTLAKSVRAYQLYQTNNPIYQRFVSAAANAFARLWERTSSLHLTVEEQAFVWGSERFPMPGGRESLAFQFYKDGIRYLTFLPGFEDEVETFLGVLQRARQLEAQGEDDLVSLLWEQDFVAFQYGYVDLLAEHVPLPEPGGVPLQPVDRGELEREVGVQAAPDEAERTSAPGGADTLATVTREEFAETLFFLDENELQILQHEAELEWHRDVRADVLAALFDRLEDGTPARQDTILGILRQLLPSFLSRSDLRSAALVLRELEGVLASGVLGEEQRARVDELFGELNRPEVLAQLIEVLEQSIGAPEVEDLGLFLAHLRPEALPVLIAGAERLSHAALRERLQAATDRLAEQHPKHVVELLRSADPVVAAGAAAAAGRLRLPAAAPALEALLGRRETNVRRAAVEALAALRSSAAVAGLERALEDDDREVRIAAARGLAALRYQPSRARFEQVLASRWLREADLTEKIVFFESYGTLGGAESVEFLDGILNGRGLLRRRASTDLRACAALALGRINAPAARAALERAAQDPDAVVRSAVSRALRRETQST
ncbi:MAG TPA: HEAT repeat domain-containing protein [Longimicrobiales bacterium]